MLALDLMTVPLQMGLSAVATPVEPISQVLLIALLVGAFLLGSIPFAYLLGRTRGLDLRKLGSGNVGATNLGRNAGIGWGIFAFFLDAAKGAVPVILVSARGGGEGWSVAAGIAAVLGHCFSPFLGFRGGKGVATMAGVLGALAPAIFFALFAVWAGLVAWKRNIGFASVLSAIAAIGAGAWVLISDDRTGGESSRLGLAVLLLALPWVVIVRHRSNIRNWFASRGSDS